MADAAWVEAVDAAPDAAHRVRALEALDAHWQAHGVHDIDVGAVSLAYHLHSATPAVSLAACAALETLVAAAHTTRTTLTLVRSVAPAALERTGDAHERVRAHTEQLLAHIADQAYAIEDHGVRESDAPHTVWERLVRDVGLTAPAPRIRIAVLRLLPVLKARHARMHLHPLLPALVDQVQAGDAGVRAAARDAIVAMFAAAPPTAHTDLREALHDAGVRVATQEALLEAVLRGAEAASAAPASPTPTAPASPGAPPLPAALTDVPLDDVRAVPLYGRHDLDTLFSPAPFDGKETELNWQPRERAVLALRGALKNGIPPELHAPWVAHVRPFQEPVLKALGSLRTTLAMHAIHLVRQLVLAFRAELEPTLDAWFVALVRMAGMTKKIVASASQVAVATILAVVPLRGLHWHQLQLGMGDKNSATRVHMCRHLHTVLQTQRRAALEAHGGVEAMVHCFDKVLADPSAEVRTVARETFVLFHRLWPAHAARVLDALPPPARKQAAALLDKPAPKRAARTGPSSTVLAAKHAAIQAQSPRRDVEARAPRPSVWHPSLVEGGAPGSADASGDWLHATSPWRAGARSVPHTPQRAAPQFAFAPGGATFSPSTEPISAEARRAAQDATASATQLSGMMAQLRVGVQERGEAAGGTAPASAPPAAAVEAARPAQADGAHERRGGPPGDAAEVPAEPGVGAAHDGAGNAEPEQAAPQPEPPEAGVEAPQAEPPEAEPQAELPEAESPVVPQTELPEAEPKAEPPEAESPVVPKAEPPEAEPPAAEPKAEPPEVEHKAPQAEAKVPEVEPKAPQAEAKLPEAESKAPAADPPAADPPAADPPAADPPTADPPAADPLAADPAASGTGAGGLPPATRYFLSRVAREDAVAGTRTFSACTEAIAVHAADAATLRDWSRRLAEGAAQAPGAWTAAPGAVLERLHAYVDAPVHDDVWALALIAVYRLGACAYGVLHTHGLELAWLALVLHVEQETHAGSALAHGASRTMLATWARVADPVLACDALRTAVRVAAPDGARGAARAAVQAAGLHTLGALWLRMPAAVRMDEVGRARAWLDEVCGRLTQALGDMHPSVRRAAIGALVAATPRAADVARVAHVCALTRTQTHLLEVRDALLTQHYVARAQRP
ncbi:suppressor of tub2 mutation [Malassezia brasiliensis]|uniref:Suppressor of tub2 mutation n=1 Tax=Malassezia brasiliensis TaxID=1821822 RepID=A0AAF0DS73_9BASI|nr:suppressor of tub2 mutation [Malassezia brasiliensis]